MNDARAAETLIRKMRKSKVPLAQMAQELNALRIKRETEWTVRDVKKVLASPEKPQPSSTPFLTDYEKSILVEDDEVTDQKSWEALKADYKSYMEREEKQATKDATAKDWIDPFKGEFFTTGEKVRDQDEYRRFALAGQDRWARNIIPIIAEIVSRTGKPVLDLLDAVRGSPAEKGQLRRVVLGLMRQLAMERETVDALRAKYEPETLKRQQAPPLTPEQAAKLFKGGSRDSAYDQEASDRRRERRGF